MEKDLNLAKKLLKQHNATCVYVKDDVRYISHEKGVSPTLTLIDEGKDLSGFSVCDCVVGKAAAMLFSFVGVENVHATLISEVAIEFLKSRKIPLTYDEKCDNIINRVKTGICPLEKATLDIDSEEVALLKIKQTLENLRSTMKKEEKVMKKLGFGFMRLPMFDKESPDMDQIIKMVDKFMENGFEYFDTAYFYLGGNSERYLNQSLIQRYDRDKFIVADKLPIMFLTEVNQIEQIFNDQLEKCGVQYFDYYLLHAMRKEGFEKSKEYKIFDFLKQKKAAGQIKKIGFSFHDKAVVLDEILTACPEIEFVQLQINYLDWEDGKIQSKLCYEVARKHGVDIIIMEPIKGGALANVPSEVEQMFKQYDPKMSVASWALRFAASLEGVVMVLSGMSTDEQMDDNLSYMKEFKPLNQQEIDMCFEAAQIIKKKNIVPCTACKYCMEVCPKNIAIADYFSLYNKNMSEGILDENAYEALSEEFGKASECVACHKCEDICPQKIEIVNELKKVKSKFE